jgi:hypothetical protein
MAPTQAQQEELDALKVELCSILRDQVQAAYAAIDDLDEHGKKWKWGADYYKDGDGDDMVWADMIQQCKEYKWVGKWRMSADQGNEWWIGPCGTFYMELELTGGDLRDSKNIEGTLKVFRLVVKGFSRGGAFITWL